MTTIEIYPNTPKPDWLKQGAKCFCLGEGKDEFTIAEVLDNICAAVVWPDGCIESWSKLYQTMEEWEIRMGRKRKPDPHGKPRPRRKKRFK